MGTEAEEHEKQTEGHILVEPGNLTGDRPFGENAGSYVLDRQQHNHACGDPRHAHLNRQTDVDSTSALTRQLALQRHS